MDPGVFDPASSTRRVRPGDFVPWQVRPRGLGPRLLTAPASEPLGKFDPRRVLAPECSTQATIEAKISMEPLALTIPHILEGALLELGAPQEA